MALYSSGKTTGIAVDSGEEQTRITPVFEGYKVASSMRSIPVAGHSITQMIADLLLKKSIAMNPLQLSELSRKIKEKFWYVAYDYNSEIKKLKRWNILYQLPDGSKVSIGNYWIKSPEVLFCPDVDKIKSVSIQEAIVESILDWDIETQRMMSQNIVLAGGSTSFCGFQQRLQKELTESLYNNWKYYFVSINGSGGWAFCSTKQAFGGRRKQPDNEISLCLIFLCNSIHYLSDCIIIYILLLNFGVFDYRKYFNFCNLNDWLYMSSI